MNADILIDFMRRLIKDSRRKVFFILDNLRVHHARKVRTRLSDHADEIEVFYLPAYSPELNLDAYLKLRFESRCSQSSASCTQKRLESKSQGAITCEAVISEACFFYSARFQAPRLACSE
jgi:hypothetical protein